MTIIDVLDERLRCKTRVSSGYAWEVPSTLAAPGLILASHLLGATDDLLIYSAIPGRFGEAGVLFCVFVVLALRNIVAHIAGPKPSIGTRLRAMVVMRLGGLLIALGLETAPASSKTTHHVHTANTAAAASSSSGYLVNERRVHAATTINF